MNNLNKENINLFINILFIELYQINNITMKSISFNNDDLNFFYILSFNNYNF